MKKFLVAILALMVSFAGLKAQSYIEWIPVGPLPVDFKIFDGRLMSEMSMEESNNEKLLNLHPNEIIAKSIIMIPKKDDMSFSSIELSQKDNTYIVRTDYLKYTSVPLKKDSPGGEVIGKCRVGVGLRIEATIKTKKKDINVTDLYQLGVEAKNGGISGNITLSIMGVESEEVTSGFPLNAEISPTSVAAALQALAQVKVAIYDKDTHLTPQIIEIQYNAAYQDGKTVEELSNPVLLPNENIMCVVIQ
ncbi:MAG: hypothetical protein H6581_21365 [Bacteroidia bacterium]|nr:hypothetical protein [Bacteroidia bacterium]